MRCRGPDRAIGTNGKAPEEENKLAYFPPRGLPIEPLSDPNLFNFVTFAFFVVLICFSLRALRSLWLEKPCNPCVPGSGTRAKKSEIKGRVSVCASPASRAAQARRAGGSAVKKSVRICFPYKRVPVCLVLRGVLCQWIANIQGRRSGLNFV